jgi:hypothetical protein
MKAHTLQLDLCLLAYLLALKHGNYAGSDEKRNQQRKNRRGSRTKSHVSEQIDARHICDRFDPQSKLIKHADSPWLSAPLLFQQQIYHSLHCHSS